MSQALVPIEGSDRLWRITAGVFSSNCYALQTSPGRCVLIDPGLGGQEIRAGLQQLDLTPQAVLCTHGHFDHGGSASVFQREHGCPVYLHRDDVKTLRASNFLMMAFRIDARVELPEVTQLGDEHHASDVVVDGCRFSFHTTPGHTPGSCVIQAGDLLFTGDTLYSRGIGLSKLPGERPDQLRASIRSVFESFGSHCRVFPGHGEAAELGWIRDHNLALLRFMEASGDMAQST
ncbi:MAG: MBL fold metallo-hydrolase [Burkholderiales bacterium]|nr:MBL fold metallo-hydrolase [Burkholderiales bacterium]